jgi:hypothetical protein
MGQTTQATGTAILSDGTSQLLSTGWQSDAPGVAVVTSAGAVSGVSNGRATIFIVSGGRQGQQVIRVVPDYQGAWSGGARITSCTQTGIWADAEACNDNAVNTEFGYTLSLEQSGELMTARLSYGSPLDFPSVAAPIRADGTASFAATAQLTESGATFTVDTVFEINSTRVGELTGKATEVWKVPNIAGEMRLALDTFDNRRTSVTSLSQELAVTTRLGFLRRMPQ